MTKLSKDNQTDLAKKRFRLILKDGVNIGVDKMRVELPQWFDEKLFLRGQKCFNTNFYSIFLAGFIGLVAVLSIPTILDVLILTNKSSNPYAAYKRYTETIKHVLKWYHYDIHNIKSKSRKSLSIVSGFHCAAAKTSFNAGLGIRVNQKDMVLTQFGFIGLVLLKYKNLAIQISEDDEMALVHFWRTIGYLLGIKDEFNLCNGSLEEVRSLCAEIMSEVYVPSLENPPPEFNNMVGYLIEGLKPISPLNDFESFMKFMWRVCDLPERKLTNTRSQITYNTQTFIITVLLTKWWLVWFFRPVMNFQIKMAIWLNESFPLFAAFKFGTKVFCMNSISNVINKKDN
ncbi:uncharacterized protein LOC126899117 [Daktulosphaira vitifoliae]|uniref:uncharacterized protein LOC126899117 n=1 Tax=Daktulosphaira vitifoliae TaxID=58002 RepID=UPI0021AA2C33|nr:uncharacterized protein LOC126899117 [Daktulosphaira vitifoliae]